jgi:hypothetical protein
MAQTRKTDRRTCRKPDPTVNLSPKSPRVARTIIDTPRRVRLLADAQSTAGKMTRKELFKLQRIGKTVGYQILKSQMARRSERSTTAAERKFWPLLNATLLRLLKMPLFALELPLIYPTQALLVWLGGLNAQFNEIWLSMAWRHSAKQKK